MTWMARIRSWIERRFPSPPLGLRGERAAARYLRRHGFQIVARGARGELGELDLVAVDGRTVVFVEVKTRRSDQHGLPAEAVDERKQERISRVALQFVRRNHLEPYRKRFDVISVIWPAANRRPSIEHIRAAFEARGVD